MLKSIEITPETGEIKVQTPTVIDEAEQRLHKSGPGTYMERFLAGKTPLKRKSGWWPEEKRIEVVALYAAGMTSPNELSRLTKVSPTTIKSWKTEDWFTDMLDKVHTSIDQDIVSKQTAIVDKALEVIQDRLSNGEYIVKSRKQPDGSYKDEVVRRPVNMRDANIVATTVVDKRQLLRGKATSRYEKIGVDDRLAKLAEEFKKFASAKTIEGEVVNEI